MSLWKRCSRTLLLLLFPLGMTGLPAHSRSRQSPTGQQNPQASTTVRVSVGLVQTDVMVFDRQERFVPGLKPEQFELRVDGKRQPIAFCELVNSGSARDDSLRTSGLPAVAAITSPVGDGADAGRTVLFFLDDWHLSAGRLYAGDSRTRAGCRSRRGAAGQLLDSMTERQGGWWIADPRKG